MDSPRRTGRSARIAARGLVLALLALSLLLLFSSSAFALFTNGGFENGTFNGWTTTTFLNPGLKGSSPFTGASIQRNAGGSNYTSILGPYTEMSQSDANTGGVLHYPLSGQYCAVVNDEGANKNGNTLTQTANVGPSDVKSDGLVHVQFAWAAVVENPGHATNEQPYVYVHVRDVSKSTDLYSSFIFAGDGSIWNTVPNSPDAAQYTNWQTIDLAPGGISVGDSIELDVTAAGCSLGGHWGYVYVDHFGSFQPLTPSVTIAGKPYDGTTAATISGGSLSGVQGSDDVALNTSGAAATFDTAQPGSGKTVTVQGLALSGADADKYILDSNTVTTQANITTAANIAAAPATPDLGYGDSTQVTATATDADGKPIPGLLITFSSSGGGVSPASALTGANGKATTTFTAGSTAGRATVTASAPGSGGGAAIQGVADLYIDGSAPTTTATNTQANGTSGWSDQAMSVTLDAQDNGPSAITTYYELDGATTPLLYVGTPILFAADGSHSIVYWSVDAAGNEETRHTGYVNIDTIAPTIADDAPSIWSASPVTVTLTAADRGSGVAKVQYKLDGASGWSDAANDQFTVAAPVDGSNDGAHLYDYQALDKAGNVQTDTCTVRIDARAPATSATGLAGDQRSWVSGAQTVTLSADDGDGSGVEATYYTLDGGATTPCTDSFQVSGSGVHTVTYWSVDNAGNTEDTQTGYVDLAAPPTTTATGLAGDRQTWVGAPPTVTLAADDAGGPGVDATYYRIDNGPVVKYGGPVQAFPEGRHTVTYWSVDTLGDSETPQTGYVNLDLTAPITTAGGLSPDTAWQDHAQSVMLSADDGSGSGVAATYYCIDGGDHQTYTGPFQVSGEGVHKVTYWSTDAAGDTEGSHDGYVDIDSSGPRTTATGVDATGDLRVAHAQTVTLSADDGAGSGVAAIFYTLDGGAKQTYGGPFQITAEGSHTVTYWATDKAGNAGPSGLGSVIIDTTAPVTTASGLAAGGHTGWVHGAQTVTLSALDGGGVGAIYYTVDGGSAQTYTGAIQVSGTGSHVITYWSVDALGNAETQHTGYVNIAPDTAIVTTATGLTADDHSGWTNTSRTVTLTPSGGLSPLTTHYSIDGGPTQAYTGPFQVTGEGAHAVRYWSTDDEPVSETPNTGYADLDVTAPVTTATAKTAWRNRPLVVPMSATDDLSGVSSTCYRNDGGAPQAGPIIVVPAPADHSMDGLHTVTYYSTDNAGNVESAQTFTARIDTTRPRVRLTKTWFVWRHNGLATVRYRVSDATVAKVRVTLRVTQFGGPRSEVFKLGLRPRGHWYTARFRLSLPPHHYDLHLQARDYAGNMGSASGLILIKR
jgi:hypothetical protein